MKFGSSQALVAQGYTNIIPSQDFVSDITYQDFMLYRCISEEKFLKALSKIKIDEKTTLAEKIKTPADVRKLANYADSGDDFKKWGVKLKDILGSIKFDESEINKAECQIAFSNDSKK